MDWRQFIYFVGFLGTFFQSSYAQDFEIFPSPFPDQVIRIQSDEITVSHNGVLNEEVSIDIVAVNVTITPSTLVFSPDKLTDQFRITPLYEGTFDIGFVMSDPNSTLVPPSNETITVRRRQINIPNFSISLLANTTSQEYFFRIGDPDRNDMADLTINFNVTGDPLRITPNAITFSPSSYLFPFSFDCTVKGGTSVVSVDIEGSDVDLFTLVGTPVQVVSCLPDSAQIPFLPTLFTNQRSSTLFVNSRYKTDFSIRPHGSILEFVPNPIEGSFDGENTFSTFSLKGNLTLVSSSVFYDSNIPLSAPSSVNIRPRSITVPNIPDLVLYDTHTFTISTYPAPTMDITVRIFGDNLDITPSLVTFTPEITSFAISITPLAPGSLTLNFFILDQPPSYLSIPSQTITVNRITFRGPDVYPSRIPVYCPTSFSIGINRVPEEMVTLSITIPGAKVEPSVLEFTPTTAVQTFTIIPFREATNAAISFTLGGSNRNNYDTSGLSSHQFDFGKRSLQMHPLQSNLDLYVRHPHELSISAECPPETGVDVVLSGPNFIFEPSILQLTSDKPGGKVIAIPQVTQSNGFLTWTPHGVNSGLYVGNSYSNLDVEFRSIDLIRVQSQFENTLSITVDEDNFTLNYADEAPTVFNFTVPVPPLDRITIRPLSPHIQFIPNVVTIMNPDTAASFRAISNVGGSHLVNFELEAPGDDALIHVVPTPTLMQVPSVGVEVAKFTGSGSLPSLCLFLYLIILIMI